MTISLNILSSATMACNLRSILKFCFLAGIVTSSWAEQREFNMSIDEVTIEVAPGFSNKVFAFNGQVPGPLLHVKEEMM